MIEYQTLSVRIEALYGERYKAIVCGPDGDGQAEFGLTFAEQDLAAAAAAVSRPRSPRRRIESDGSAYARELGGRLFDTVFQASARDVLRASLAQARRENQGLRMMLQLDGAPRLRNVPWELLWDSPKFVSTSAYTPVLRYVDIPSRPPPLSLRPPLRILGMVSSPGDMAALDAGREQAQLLKACDSLIEKGLLQVDWAEEASLAGLLRYLNQSDYHIFHFIGHGDFDEQVQDGVLLFEAQAGRSQRVTGVELGTILSDQHTLRLAVINACEGARTALDSDGIAVSLMRYGVPAAIAMQFEISDEAAIDFASYFYDSIARSHPIDKAVADARRGMYADGHRLEWATPVLFTSVDDGRLFEIDWEGLNRPGIDDSGGRGWSPSAWVVAGMTAMLAALFVLALVLTGVFSGGSAATAESAIPIGRSPVGLAVGGGRVWVTSSDVGKLSWINPETHVVNGELTVGDDPNSVAVEPDGHGYVWVALLKDDEVAWVDPRRHVVVDQRSVGREPNTIAVGEGAAWVANSGDATVSRIDLHTHDVTTVDGVGAHPSGIAVGFGSVWVASSGAHTVAQIEPATGKVVHTIDLGRSVQGIAVSGDAIWVSNPHEGSVSRIGPHSGEFQPIQVGGRPEGIAAGPSGVWVASSKGSVSHIDPSSGEVLGKPIPVQGQLKAIAVDSKQVWVANLFDSTVVPIRP